MKRIAAAGLVVPILLGAAGCTRTVKQSSMESQISDQLASGGVRPDKVTCDGNLNGKTGATQHCTVSANGEDIPVTVTVTNVTGNKVEFDVRCVTPSPSPSGTTSASPSPTGTPGSPNPTDQSATGQSPTTQPTTDQHCETH